MGDILKPNTSESLVEQVRRRRIPTIGNAVSSPAPAPTPPPVVEQQPVEQQEQPVPVAPPAPPHPVVEQQPVPVEEQPVPVEEQTPVEQQQQGVELPVEPAPPTLQEQQSVPSVFPSQGFQTEEPRQPNANFGDILTAPTLQPIYRSSEETQRRAQPEEMVEALQSIQVPHVQFANVPITGRNIITSRVEALREANAHIVRQNRGGLQDFMVTPGGGERVFSTSAIDNALAGTGLGSIIGTNLQDRLDPNRDSNTATGLLGWLQRVGNYSRSLIERDRKNRMGLLADPQVPGLLQGVLGWIISNPAFHYPLDRSAEGQARREAWEQEGWNKFKESGGLDQLTNNTTAETPAGQYTLEKYGSVFDPAMGYWGDAGKNPLLSPLIYLLNIPENILMGMVYDTADALGFDKTNSWSNRTRTLGALSGRDWGVSNRWSDERYISLQEPEGQVAGQRTGNPYWDLPENIARAFGQSESGRVSKNLHIVFQTVPAMLGEVITGGVADLGVDNVLKLPSKVGDLTSLGRQMDDLEAVLPDLDIPGVRREAAKVPKAPVVSDDSIKVITQNIDPSGNPVVVKVETEPVVPKAPDDVDFTGVNPEETFFENTPKVETPDDLQGREDAWLGGMSDNFDDTEKPLPKVEVGDGQVIEVKDIPSGRRVSDNVVEEITTPKAEEPPSAENLVRRPLSEREGTELARRQGIIEPDFKRTLSEEELAELARQRGRLFDGQTTMHPDYPNASFILLEDGTIRKIVLSQSDDTLIKEGLPSVDELVAINKDLDDMLKQYAVSPDAEKFERLNNLIRRNEEALLRHAAEPAESAYTTKLLENELPSTQESFSTAAKEIGNEMVNTERALTSQRVVIDQLIQEVDEIKVVRNQLEEAAPTIKPVGRQNIEEALGTLEVYSGRDVPEMGFKVTEADQYADLVGNGFNPAKPNSTTDDWIVGKLPATEFAKKNSEMTLWFHGTSSSVPIQEVDILKGATPSEYGLGVYLTKNETVADQAALALPQINRPPRPESVDVVPVRYTVDTSKVTRVFDLDAPMPKDIDELFYQTTVSIFGKNVADDAFRQATTNVKLREAWDAVRDSVYNVSGAPASEKQIREFQQVILEGFKERDVQAGLLKSGDNPVLVVYNPKLLTPAGVPEKLPAPPFIKQYEARGWLDKLTRQTEPSNSNIHNAMQSNLDYAEQATREAAENLAIELNKQKEMLEDYIVKKDNLETVIRKEQKETVRQLEATGDTVEAVHSVMRNDLVEAAQTRKWRARQSSEAKDYSVPPSKRGKNPPAVSDKPISSDVLPRQKLTPRQKERLWKEYDEATRVDEDGVRQALILDELDKSDIPDLDEKSAEGLWEQLRKQVEDTPENELRMSQRKHTSTSEDKLGSIEVTPSSSPSQEPELPKQLPQAETEPTPKAKVEVQQKKARGGKKEEPTRVAEPEAVPVEVTVEPIGVPLEGKKRIPLGDRIRAEADKIREASKQEVKALSKILENTAKISKNYEDLVSEVSHMVQEDLDDALKLEAGTTPEVKVDLKDLGKRTPEKVPVAKAESVAQNTSKLYSEVEPDPSDLFGSGASISADVPKKPSARKVRPPKPPEGVPTFTVKSGTQLKDIEDWRAAGQVGVYKFGETTEFMRRYGKAEEEMDRFSLDAGGASGIDLNYVENTFENQRNFQNILNGKNPVFDHNPYAEWVPSTGELVDYYSWTDYAKKYSNEKYVINKELAEAKGAGVEGFKGELVDLGKGKTFYDRQEEFLMKYADAETPGGVSVLPEMLENTHWNLEAFKRIREGKKPLGNPNANPVTEWVPSTKELRAYKNWDDYANQYSVSKYTSNSTTTTTPVSPKVRSHHNDKLVDDLLKDWDDVDLDDVRSANKQVKKFTTPELEDPCL